MRDDAGRVRPTALAVPVIKSNKIKVVYKFGDESQLLPHGTQLKYDEFSAYQKQSVLWFATQKGVTNYLLNVQYRSHPTIMQFVNERFYKGQIWNHHSTYGSIDVRKAFREAVEEVTLEKWRDEQQYVVIDVVNGRSHAEDDGPSLTNYVNVSTAARLVKALPRKKVDPCFITVLVYYAGQKLVFHIKMTSNGPVHQLISVEQAQRVTCETVDSYQGQQNKIVIVDFVVARNSIDQPQTRTITILLNI